MHTYLESVGFSRVKKKREFDGLLNDVVFHYDKRTQYQNGDGLVIGEFRKEYAPDMGIAVIGELEDNQNFHPEYYYPYYESGFVSTEQQICFEKHAGSDSYAGACEDMRLGATIIFHLVNNGDFMRSPDKDSETMIRPVCLSALARESSILIPLSSELRNSGEHMKQVEKRSRLIAQARGGDEKAMESLSMEEMGNYEILSRRVEKEDILSIVDSYLIPYGVECDQYSVLGNILECEAVENAYSGESIYKLLVEVCDMSIQVCVNENSLQGEPKADRRFKGLIWLQGTVKF